MKKTMKFSQVLSRFLGIQTAVLDVGSSSTRVMLDGKLVFHQPSCIAIHTESGTVVAIGDQAQRLLGKTPKQIAVVFPVNSGAIADTEHATAYIKAVMRRVLPELSISRQLVGFSGYIGIPPKLSPVQTSFLLSVVRESGFGSVQLISQAQALYQQLGVGKTDTVTIIDLGGQKTSCSVFTGGTLVEATTIPIGGVHLTEAIQHYFRTEHEGLLGWHSAEIAKRELELVPTKGHRIREQKMNLRTKDIVTQKSKTITVTTTSFQQPLLQIVEELAEQLELFLGSLPTELVTSILDTGIHSTGGTSQLRGIIPVLAELLHTNIYPSDDPELDCVRGLQQVWSKDHLHASHH